jgi:LPXTG-site transpeptidase (sortase) family protein
MYAAAVMVFGLGLYGGLSGLSANKKVAVQVKMLQQGAQVKGDSTGTTDETVPPSTEKPSAASVRSYAVSPMNPRYIDVPKLKVHARVLSMGVDRKNELQAPYGIYDAGWYNASSHPGENGAMLIDGHSGIGKTHGIFHDLTQLAAGDDITVTRGDGQTFTYKVVDLQVVDKEQVDMGSLLVSANTAKPGLTLITCAGSQVPGTFSLQQRVIVRAVMQ